MSLQNIGRRGEEMAKKFLQKKGFQIMAQNYRTKSGEIDIIAKKEGMLVFFEVKTRISDRFGKPYESVTPLKLEHFQKAVNFYLLENQLFNLKMRIDVISIILNNDLSVKEIQHFENIFYK